MSRMILLMLLVSFIGCANAVVKDEPEAEDLARGFHNLPMQGVRFIDGGLATSCVDVTPVDRKRIADYYGPHMSHFVSIYLNPTAERAKVGAIYPVGSAIVKEKALLINAKRVEDGVGGMIKRAPGYDPANGDWEYFYVEPAGKLHSGKLTSCINCHRGAADTDFVFREWDDEQIPD